MNVALKSQDIAALLAVQVSHTRDWSFQSLASGMGVSASYVHYALQRAGAAGLYRPEERAVHVLGLLEFLEHGVRWSFYVQLGGRVRGVPTAHSGPVLADKLSGDPAGAVVWPSKTGVTLGQALEPLYPQAAVTAERVPELYAVLTLVDALRLGRRRDSTLAMQELRARVEASWIPSR